MKIAISGPMCSGKTTIANLINENNNYNIYSFGQKIKDIANELFDMNKDFKDRSLLINIADKMRDIDPDVWINQILQQTTGKRNCIIDDVRYQNEVDALIKDGWIFIQLDVPYTIQKQRIMKLYPNNYQEHLDAMNHVSEQNNFIFPDGYPHLRLKTSDENQEKNKHEINLLSLKE